ncbi:MAG: hypothetical protein JOZ69_19265 [Myxococcales bacterium]|nr:hypothetical protein [Myxococcales bacterium]
MAPSTSAPAAGPGRVPPAAGAEIAFRSLLWGSPALSSARRAGATPSGVAALAPGSSPLVHGPLHPAAQAHAPSSRAVSPAPESEASDSGDEERGGSPRTPHAPALSLAGGPGAVPLVSPVLPFEQAPPSAAVTTQARASASLEELLPALVRRIAWSGDRHRGTVRLEIGAGELEGAILVLHADGAAVRLELDVPAGVDARRWQERLQRRLSDSGVAADAVDVR